MLSTIEKAASIAKVPIWFHTYDFGDNVVTKGMRSLETLEQAWKAMRVPDLRGKAVLDINTWDGWFALKAEKCGAERVVGLDRYVWCMDLPKHFEYWNASKASGQTPKQYHEMPYFRPDELPGKAGFDTARRIAGSRVEEVVGDFPTMDISPLRSQFDVVFYLGSLYHMTDPLGSIQRLFEVTAAGGTAIVETHAIAIPGWEHVPLCEHYGPINLLNADSSNFWGPNALALKQMLLGAGFESAEILEGPPRDAVTKSPHIPAVQYYRALARAHRAR